MMKRLLATLLLLFFLIPAAQAGGRKESHLIPQEGAYQPEYSVTCTFSVRPGQDFEWPLYRDQGTLPLLAAPNGGSLPAGASLAVQENTGEAARQACLTGMMYAEGKYTFGVLIQEQDAERARTLAILHVTLLVTGDAAEVEPYLGDGEGMLRLIARGVNLRKTPGGTRLDQYDEGTRFVWCDRTEKGGYTWYRVWTADYGYAYLRGDTVQEETPLRLVYTPDKETAFPLFITPGSAKTLVPSLIMTENPEVIGFDTQPLATVVRGADTWTLLCFCVPGEQRFWIKADLRTESGEPLECQLVYLTPAWEDLPPYENQ